MKRRLMDLLIFWLPIIGGGFFIAYAGNAYYSSFKIQALWLFFIGIVCLSLVLVIQLHQRILATSPNVPVASQENIKSQDPDQRAWIKIMSFDAGPLSYDMYGARLGVQAKVVNVGKYLARDVFITADIYLIGTNHLDPLREQRIVCDGAKQTPIGRGDLIFPGDEKTFRASYPIGQNEINKRAFIFPNKPGKRYLYPVIVGCISYRWDGAADYHQTGFAFNVHEKGNKAVPQEIIVKPGESAAINIEPAGFIIEIDRGDIPLGQVGTVPWIGGGEFAD